MKHIRVSRGKELDLLRKTQAHNDSCGKIRTWIEKLYWKFGRMAYCPQDQRLTKFDVKTYQHKTLDTRTGKGEVIVVGIIHECLNCNLQIRKGFDNVSDAYIGGIFKPEFGFSGGNNVARKEKKQSQ